MLESLGRRIAALRNARGWTQQRLAERLGLSRVAVSHLEVGMSVPSERTIVLLSGVFGVEPHELIEGTSYPPAKAERLPLVAARYTEVEHQLALMASDLEWSTRTGDMDVLDGWVHRLAVLDKVTLDPEERDALAAAHHALRQARGRR